MKCKFKCKWKWACNVMVCNGMYVSISVWEKHGKTCHHEPLDHSRKHWKTAPLQPPLKHLSPVDLW